MSNARPAFVELDTIATQPVQLYGFYNGAPVRLSADADGKLSMEGLRIPTHDEIDVAYSGGNPVTVTFKKASAVVATLTVSYTDGVPTNIMKG